MTKSELLSSIQDIIDSPNSIKLHIDRVAELREQVDEILTDDERVIFTNNLKSRVQQEAEKAFFNSNGWGSVYMGTGSGKSKIGVDSAKRIVQGNPKANILLSVPTEKLRDENWLEEFNKWDCGDIWEHHVQRCCYASLNKYEGETFDLVILDEGHNITENNSSFFKKNVVKRCILLTATKPRDTIKLGIIHELGLHPIYELNLDDCVKLGLVAPYDIIVVTMFLNSTDKYIKAGRKEKPFFNTEKAQYGYLSTRLAAMPNKMGFIDRMRFIYTLRSKTRAAQYILEAIIPKDLRTLIFCGSKEQANQVCEHRFYSKPSPPKKLPENATPSKKLKYEADMLKYKDALAEYRGDESLNLFKQLLINRCSCVDALNEGHNISGLDVGFIVQLNSNELNLVQRIGRLLRYRPGHTGMIIILCVEDSVDKDWVRKSTANLNTSNIRYVELSRLMMGLETISFD